MISELIRGFTPSPTEITIFVVIVVVFVGVLIAYSMATRRRERRRRIAMADGAIGEGQVSALRVRLGFSGQPAGAEPESSAEIPTGSGVVLADSHDRMIRGRVMEPTPSSFRVSTDEDAPRLTSGSLVEAVYQDGTGVYRFDPSVLANPPGEMSLSHAERIERVQRRRYYRGKVRLPVYVKPRRRAGASRAHAVPRHRRGRCELLRAGRSVSARRIRREA